MAKPLPTLLSEFVKYLATVFRAASSVDERYAGSNKRHTKRRVDQVDTKAHSAKSKEFYTTEAVDQTKL